jgi:hypothetical protein
MRRSLLAVGLALFWGCGSSTSSSVSTVNLSGNYSGSITDSINGAGTIHFTLVQAASSITGTFESVYPAGTSSGAVSGTANGLNVTATLTPSVPTLCPFNVVAIPSNFGEQLEGTAVAFNCPAETAAFTVTR